VDENPRPDPGLTLPKGIASAIAAMIVITVVLAAWPTLVSAGRTRHSARAAASPEAPASPRSEELLLQTLATAWQEETVPEPPPRWHYPEPSRRSLGVDAAGNAYVLWEDYQGIDDPSPEVADLWFAARLVDGSWELPTKVDVRNQSCGNCHSDNAAVPGWIIRAGQTRTTACPTTRIARPGAPGVRQVL